MTLLRLDLKWSLASGAESAINSLWFEEIGGPAPVSAFSDAVASAWDTPVRAVFSQHTAIAGLQVVAIDQATGNTLAVVNGTIPEPANGSSDSESLPTEVAECATLRSSVAGGSHRGRIYLPPVTRSQLDTNGYMQSSTCDLLANFVADIITGVRTNVVAGGATGCEAVVYSRALRSLSTIITVDVGNVFDVQRRRRRSLVETRHTVDVS